MKARHRAALAAACAGWAACAAVADARAEPVAWRLDPERTRVHWEVRHYGTSTARGRFDAVSGSIELDAAARRGHVSVVVDTASVSTGLAVFDRVLRGADLLDAANHPQAWFVASRVEFDGERVSALRGELTLRGASQPFALTARHFACDAEGRVCGGDFEGELLRSAFGITHALGFAADRVQLLVTVQARRP